MGCCTSASPPPVVGHTDLPVSGWMLCLFWWENWLPNQKTKQKHINMDVRNTWLHIHPHLPKLRSDAYFLTRRSSRRVDGVELEFGIKVGHNLRNRLLYYTHRSLLEMIVEMMFVWLVGALMSKLRPKAPRIILPLCVLTSLCLHIWMFWHLPHRAVPLGTDSFVNISSTQWMMLYDGRKGRHCLYLSL